MILKALYDYYHAVGNLPPNGMEVKEIEYVAVISSDGRFLRFESTRIDKKNCASFCVAKAVGRTSAPISNTLWDNGKYVFGFGDKDNRCHSLFIERVRDIARRHPDDESIRALDAFYAQSGEERMRQLASDTLYADASSATAANFSFRLEGDDRLIAEKSHLFLDDWEMSASSDGIDEGVCLITGRRGPIVRTTTSTPIAGNSPGASLVSFQVNSGYDSYAKKQAYNAPISPDAEFAYSSALKSLTAKDSRNKAVVGKRTFLFWGAGNRELNRQVEDSFFHILDPDAGKKSDPNERVAKAKALFKSIWSGQIATTLDDRFHILGLAPNAGRIAVVFWQECTLREFADKIFRHFSDMQIVDYRLPQKQRPYYGIYQMLAAVTLGGKVSDSTPNLAEALMESVINGTQYPAVLLTSVIERIRAELHDTTVGIQRAAILKACVNRQTKLSTTNKQLTEMLDKTNTNPGYLCGRLVAVLEKIQDDASSGDSIRTRYMAAASATPAAVLSTMLNLSIHHSEKLSDGKRIYYEQLKQEIVDKLSASGFPAHLDITDQGRFFVGYYHQRASLFTKKETTIINQ